VVTGVDSGMAPMKRHGNAWRTVGELAEGGYPAAEALAAATSVAADACGQAGVTGRLAEGYAADVLVVDGDLAQDLSRLGTPREVLIRGASVDLS
jgi:imidazolonepropionase-like amidohydrolase